GGWRASSSMKCKWAFRRGEGKFVAGLRHAFRRINCDVDLSRVVPQRHIFRSPHPRRPHQRFIELSHLYSLQRIGLMMNASAIELMRLVDRIKDVTLNEKMFERA